jgi:hypothetical protein
MYARHCITELLLIKYKTSLDRLQSRKSKQRVIITKELYINIYLLRQFDLSNTKNNKLNVFLKLKRLKKNASIKFLLSIDD